MIEVYKYTAEKLQEWNKFVLNAKNSTFMLDRGFVEYHKDRFSDYSLIIYEDKKIVALLPANKSDENSIMSHSGLTYGGIIIGKELKLISYLEVFKEILKFLNKNGISKLEIKLMPDFYTNIPSQEYQYALFLVNSKRVRVDTALVIQQENKLKYQDRRKRSIKKATRHNFNVKKDNNFMSFWNEILSPNLLSRFGVKPVHSLVEINLLASRFPENISQVNIYENGEILAGATIFETENVAHAQYISSNDFGRSSGALDLLFDEMINKIFLDKKIFDFGICNEQGGFVINKGLLNWKEGFGGRTLVHEFHSVTTADYVLLDSVISSM